MAVGSKEAADDRIKRSQRHSSDYVNHLSHVALIVVTAAPPPSSVLPALAGAADEELKITEVPSPSATRAAHSCPPRDTVLGLLDAVRLSWAPIRTLPMLRPPPSGGMPGQHTTLGPCSPQQTSLGAFARNLVAVHPRPQAVACDAQLLPLPNYYIHSFPISPPHGVTSHLSESSRLDSQSLQSRLTNTPLHFNIVPDSVARLSCVKARFYHLLARTLDPDLPGVQLVGSPSSSFPKIQGGYVAFSKLDGLNGQNLHNPAREIQERIQSREITKLMT
ncbi:hypothetical protein FB451DRAFT_1190176 [Mycena latifolia]|nr:hypothetical protein FB451DRAFT_1190176 [Mycena latifolia]